MMVSNEKRVIVEQGLILIVIYFLVNFMLDRGGIFELAVESFIVGIGFMLLVASYNYWRGNLHK
ncbi:hypothetical protein C488_11118 [Natrinema pellirubrum DSM 15624]|uniref:Uncharacterized protein n=1 Tax=Natrinema pellirubrum (strain DSM 15624 / CIP 106293 / JCM 10476 / NCIMB 786 / 157) TaxID=797303 RepID=L0JMZ9_NATP1|nr:hypothetical protein Natpe_2402 [Natrinema pellirubrum DSM 15624]ELY74997.1 hypothetical protein C488_11118 [Natrinema pellirubrum DSM 15624]